MLYIQSEGNYSMLHITSGDSFLLTSQLGQIEQLISQQMAGYEPTFVRVGKALIINLRYVFYINAAQQKLQLLDAHLLRHDLVASQQALRDLKVYFDSMGTKQTEAAQSR